MGCFSELDIVVRHNFDPIAPWIAAIESLADQLDSDFLQRRPHRLAAIHHETEMPLVIRALHLAKAQLDKLIAEIDKSIVLAFPAKREIKNRAVEFQRFVQATDLQNYMIDSQRARFLCFFSHKSPPVVSPPVTSNRRITTNSMEKFAPVFAGRQDT